jgi:hypothetical protein
MKQTAVEWLEEQMKTWGNLPIWMRDDIVKKAKEMEKEQIINAWDNGYDKGTRDRIEKISNPVGNAEQYYNKTYKNTEE